MDDDAEFAEKLTRSEKVKAFLGLLIGSLFFVFFFPDVFLEFDNYYSLIDARADYIDYQGHYVMSIGFVAFPIMFIIQCRYWILGRRARRNQHTWWIGALIFFPFFTAHPTAWWFDARFEQAGYQLCVDHPRTWFRGPYRRGQTFPDFVDRRIWVLNPADCADPHDGDRTVYRDWLGK